MKVLASVLTILIGLAAICGATLAWFSDRVELKNEFTAGTVDIKVWERVSQQAGLDCDDDWTEEPVEITNWNPGDCYYKHFKVTNKGSKKIYLKGEFKGQWYEKDKDGKWVAWELPEGKEDPVTVEVVQGDKWQELDGTFFYKGIIPANTTVYLSVKISLNGKKADNAFQGKRYVLTADFQAIQTTHGAEADQWGYEYSGNKWRKAK